MTKVVDVRHERERLLARKAALLEEALIHEEGLDEIAARELREVSLALDRLRREARARGHGHETEYGYADLPARRR